MRNSVLRLPPLGMMSMGMGGIIIVRLVRLAIRFVSVGVVNKDSFDGWTSPKLVLFLSVMLCQGNLVSFSLGLG